MSRRVAAIDCGTNSIRLLVADLDPAAGPLADVHREMRVVRLGEGVDATGRLSEAALARTGAALNDYAKIIEDLGAVAVRMAATSASRDARNRQDFVDLVVDVLGQEPEVITGDEEAELSFRGAVGELPAESGPFLVADIGGGSTELVAGTNSAAGVRIDGRISLDIGCVRITERILHGDPPTAEEVRAARAWAAEMLSGGLKTLPLEGVRRFIPVSGTATTVAAAALSLEAYDAGKIHLSTISADSVHEVARDLLHAKRSDRASLGYMHEGRVDVIGGGSLVLSVLVGLVQDLTGIDEITVSEHDILDGLALSLG